MDKRLPPRTAASNAAAKTQIRSNISTSTSKFPNKRNWQTISHGSTKIQSEVPASSANKLAGNCLGSTKKLDFRKQIKLSHTVNLPKTKSTVTLSISRTLNTNSPRLALNNVSASTFNVGSRKTSTPKHRVLSDLQPLKREQPIETSSLRLKKNIFPTPKIQSTQTSRTKPAKPTLSKSTPSQTPLNGEILKIPKIFVNSSTNLNKKSTISGNNINNNSLTAINRNLKAKGNKVAIEVVKKGTSRTSNAIITTSRGQGPSGSKTSTTGQQISSGHHPPLKSSSSVSSLDGIGIKLHSTKIKNHGSKDKIDQNHKNSKDKLDKGSKERVADFADPVILPKSKKKNSPMPIIQQHAIANNNLIDERESSNNHTIADKNSSRDLANINFDGTRENSHQPQSIMQDLQSHLERLTREKMALEAKVMELSSYQTEVVQLRTEIIKLQNMQEKSNIEIQKLTDENETLRNRLRDVVNSPLSDAEKHQIIQESQRLHSSAPASIALPNNHEADGTPCVTPDWDKHSSSSEISVACLQDKIIQMEETHYSTNEELQATLQELADLQNQLTEIQSDNERLAEEKDVLFQSLCRQTEKLEDSRTQIGTLQELLLRESNQADVGTTEREQKLYDLLKNAQEERENLLVKQEELNSELNELRQALENSSNENSRLRERISWLDSTVDAATAERKQIESQLTQAKENSSEKQIEISRLTTLLENARAKIDELEQDRAMGEKSDLGELLDVARKEKDALEGQVASLQEQVSKSHCEIQKLKDQLAGITEECKVARNNAKCALSDLEYRYETLKEEKHKLSVEYQQLQDSTNELQVQCKCHLEDKSQLESLLSETQRHLGEAERLLAEKEERLQEEIKLRKQEAEEWEQFQSDLLMTVRVANDFKTEAQSAREQLVMDNKTQREKIRMLEQQIEKLNKQISSDTQQSLLTTVQQEMAARRQKVGISRQDSRLSVKSLIESIENVNKQTKAGGPGSRCSSSSSLNSVTSDALNGGTTQNGSNRTVNNDWSENAVPQNQLNAPVVGLQAKSPLREQQQTAGINITLSNSQKTLITDVDKRPGLLLNNYNSSNIANNNNFCSTTTSTLNNNSITNSHSLHEKVCKQSTDDPCVTSMLCQKTMDFVRRNSYGDLSERKDPLNALVKNGGSKRNALLKWCQNKTVGYRNIDITNFSSSWNDGLAFCAILHSYLPDRVPYDTLGPNNKRRNFSIAFSAAESVGIPTSLNINEMCQQERPDWTQVMAYVTAIYKHFET